MLEGRFNIGLLVANITDDFSNGISKGAMREAKKLNADLTIIPGKYLGLEHRYEDIDARYEYQYNLLFDHAAAAKFDYIIAAVGTIAYALSSEKKREFLEKFRDTPLLCVAADIEGFDCLQFDNKSGVRCAIDYLAAQGKKHIAMMSGDPNSSDCCERFEAYKEGLAANGLEYDPQLVMESDVSAYCLDEAKKLIESAPQTDAVICVNDAVAAVVCQVLQEKGKRIGPDVAVVGFDDLPSSAQMSPPLASVKADAEIMGEAAVKIAVNRLRGVEDNELLIPTKFIPRQSSYAKDEAFNGLDSVFIGDQGDIKRKMAEYISGLELDSEPAHEITEFSIGLYEHICENYLSGEITPEILRSTKKLIDEQLPRLLLSHSAVAALFDLIDSVYEWTAEQNHGENIRQIREIHDHIYKQLCVIISVGQKVIQDRFVMRSHMDNIFIRDTLMVDDDLKESYAKIMRRLCDVGALTGYLYIFDEPIIHRLHQSFPDNVTWNFKSYNYGGVTFTVDEQEQ
ncbi:MAG: substrate-binding domain-containing protein, partial [Ruminococcus sp.]|nr:substrate-binding domain-containing protein [Ruminococcus sp.]